MNIYVASSWRNEEQPGLVARLRAQGHRVYDFKNPNGDGPNTGFGWQQIDPNWRTWTLEEYRLALTHAVAQKGFESDERGMVRADACVLCLPAGRSAHVEWGWMVGRGQIGYVLLSEKGFDPDLMYLLTPLARICITEEELFQRIAEDGLELARQELNRAGRVNACVPGAVRVGEEVRGRLTGTTVLPQNLPRDTPLPVSPVGDEVVVEGGTCNLPPPGDPLLLYIARGAEREERYYATSVTTQSAAFGGGSRDEVAAMLKDRGYVPIPPTLRDRLDCLRAFEPETEVFIHEERGLGKDAKEKADAYFESIKHLLP